MWARVFRDSPLIRWLSGRAARYDLAISMTSVRAGDRLLYLGDGDAQLFASIAARTGLSGTVCVLAGDEAAADRVRGAAERQGVLVDVAQAAPAARFSFAESAFDLAVVDAGASAPVIDYADVRRVLRPGGRVVALGYGTGGGWMRRPTVPPGLGEQLRQAMQAAFPAARVLAERDGWVFVEGLKGRG